MIRRVAALSLLLVVAACASGPRPAATPAAERPANMREAGLERVIGRSATQLVELFGDADLDQREGGSRRMQFVGPACVLDAYLAPKQAGSEPVGSYVDARLPSGDDIDRASCVAALSRRAQAK